MGRLVIGHIRHKYIYIGGRIIILPVGYKWWWSYPNCYTHYTFGKALPKRFCIKRGERAVAWFYNFLFFLHPFFIIRGRATRKFLSMRIFYACFVHWGHLSCERSEDRTEWPLNGRKWCKKCYIYIIIDGALPSPGRGRGRCGSEH